MHFLFLAVLVIFDSIITGVVKNIGSHQFLFISNLAFLGIILLIQNDNSKETFIKAAILAFWMDINHINSFPVFFISYTITVLIMRLWQRQITTSFFEFVVIAIVALFIKESLMFITMKQILNIQFSFMNFLGNRVFIVILGNSLFVYPLLNFYKKIHRIILNETQDLRTY